MRIAITILIVATLALAAAAFGDGAGTQPAAESNAQSDLGANVLAKLQFSEDMGYSIGVLAKGVKSHTNNDNTLDDFPDAWIGKSYTLVVSNVSSPVQIRFITSGKIYVLAGIHSRETELAALAKVAKREASLTATDSTVWSITASEGTQIVIPFQVCLIAESLEKGLEQNNDTQSLADEAERLRAKAASAQQVLDGARAAAIQRLSQTQEYQDAEAAIANAQNEIDAADNPDGRAQAAADKVNAKSRLDRLIASDQSVIDATKSVAEAGAELKAAEDRLEKAQADVAAARRAAVASERASEAQAAAAKAAADEPIKAAMAQHTLAIGMTLDECNTSIGRAGRITGADESATCYEWDQLVGRDSLGNPAATIHFSGVIRDGKLASFNKADPAPFDAGTFQSGP